MTRDEVVEIVAYTCALPTAKGVGRQVAERIVDALEEKGILRFEKVLVGAAPNFTPSCARPRGGDDG